MKIIQHTLQQPRVALKRCFIERHGGGVSRSIEGSLYVSRKSSEACLPFLSFGGAMAILRSAILGLALATASAIRRGLAARSSVSETFIEGSAAGAATALGLRFIQP
jgi:hypothetical protein